MQGKARILSMCLAAPILLSCASLRQNIRGQELSFRGVYHCEGKRCSEGEMVRSAESEMEGTTTIQKIDWGGKIALAFTAAAPMKRLEARARDCEGNETEISSIQKPGTHEIGNDSIRASWVVQLERAPLLKAGLKVQSKGKCSRVLVRATGHWDDGATHELAAGVRAR